MFQSEKEANDWLSLSKNLTEEREELRKDLAKLQARLYQYGNHSVEFHKLKMCTQSFFLNK